MRLARKNVQERDAGTFHEVQQIVNLSLDISKRKQCCYWRRCSRPVRFVMAERDKGLTRADENRWRGDFRTHVRPP
jgi:hypothetical protein